MAEVSTRWGVRYAGHRDGEQLSVVAVDERVDRPAAVAWLAALLRCGNSDAVLVWWDAIAGVWMPVDGAL